MLTKSKRVAKTCNALFRVSLLFPGRPNIRTVSNRYIFSISDNRCSHQFRIIKNFIFLCIGSEITYTLLDFLKIYGLVALGSISATLVLMVFASFFKKSSTQGSFGVLVSAAIGFITGAYIPVSQFSESIQTGVNLVPASQIAGMMKYVLITPTIDHANDVLNGIDNGEFAKAMYQIFSVKMNIFSNEVDFGFMLMYSLIAIAVFLIINLALYRFTSKNK